MPSQHLKKVRFKEKVVCFFFHASSPMINIETFPSFTMDLSSRTTETRLLNYTEDLVPAVCLETSILSWKIFEDPRSVSGRWDIVSKSTLSQPATTPPVLYMKIILPDLPWFIKVSPSFKIRSHITVEDVLVNIFNTLRENVTTQEFRALPSETDKMRVKQAYDDRVKNVRRTSAEAAIEERDRGVRRMDFLMERILFNGIELVNHETGEWRIMVV